MRELPNADADAGGEREGGGVPELALDWVGGDDTAAVPEGSVEAIEEGEGLPDALLERLSRLLDEAEGVREREARGERETEPVRVTDGVRAALGEVLVNALMVALRAALDEWLLEALETALQDADCERDASAELDAGRDARAESVPAFTALALTSVALVEEDGEIVSRDVK